MSTSGFQITVFFEKHGKIRYLLIVEKWVVYPKVGENGCKPLQMGANEIYLDRFAF